MAKKIEWDISLINRPRFTLTAEHPIRLSISDHVKKIGSRFDMHYDLELGIVLSGKMKRHYQGYDMTLNPGDIWTCGMWEPHGYEVMETPSRTIVMVIHPQALIGVRFSELPGFNPMAPFTVLPEQRPKLIKAKREQMYDIAAKLNQLQRDISPEKEAWLRVYLYEILLTLMSGWTVPRGNIANNPNEYAHVNRAIQMIFDSKRLVTEQEISSACGISRNRFNELFENTMGISFSKFALKYRLSNVANNLLHTDEPLKAIAIDWGFTDSSHLHKLFLQYYGCSPIDYRKKYVKHN